MPLLPPELSHPFRSPAQRAAGARAPCSRDTILRLIEALVSKPAMAWSPAEQAAFPSVTNGVADPPPLACLWLGVAFRRRARGKYTDWLLANNR